MKNSVVKVSQSHVPVSYGHKSVIVVINMQQACNPCVDHQYKAADINQSEGQITTSVFRLKTGKLNQRTSNPYVNLEIRTNGPAIRRSLTHILQLITSGCIINTYY